MTGAFGGALGVFGGIIRFVAGIGGGVAFCCLVGIVGGGFGAAFLKGLIKLLQKKNQIEAISSRFRTKKAES